MPHKTAKPINISTQIFVDRRWLSGDYGCHIYVVSLAISATVVACKPLLRAEVKLRNVGECCWSQLCEGELKTLPLDSVFEDLNILMNYKSYLEIRHLESFCGSFWKINWIQVNESKHLFVKCRKFKCSNLQEYYNNFATCKRSPFEVLLKNNEKSHLTGEIFNRCTFEKLSLAQHIQTLVHETFLNLNDVT